MILDIINSFIEKSIKENPNFDKMTSKEKDNLRAEYYNKIFAAPENLNNSKVAKQHRSNILI